MLGSTQAGVFLVATLAAFLFLFCYLGLGMFQEAATLRDVIDAVSNTMLTAPKEPPKRELLEKLDGTSFQSMGYDQSIACGRSGRLDGMPVSIVLMTYHFEGSERTQSRDIPIVFAESVVRDRNLTGRLPDDAEDALKPETIAAIHQLLSDERGLHIEAHRGTIYLAITNPGLRSLLAGLRHPLRTHAGRLEADLRMMVRACQQLKKAFKR